MKGLGSMMKQAQEMQKRMEEMQQKLAEMEVDGSAGGDMVSVVVTGKGNLLRLKIDPSLIESKDSEMLEDLIVAAVNDGKAKAEAVAAEEMSKITGGLNLPGGLKLPM